ncbi:MAG: glycosyltransferase family 39 protein [Acidimicrobiales bacterium]
MTVAPGNTDAVPAPGTRADAPRRAEPTAGPARLLPLLAALAIAAGVLARAWPRSALWLDEAQSVAFARLPLFDIPGALRTDGAPPLYYLLLHVWMRAFGDGDAAIRWLSVVLSIATIAVLWLAVRRLAGERAAWLAATLLAINPFAIRYAAEGRMYALVVLEVCLAMVALPAALRRPEPVRLAAVALLTAALLYTHYWSLYLLAATGIAVLLAARRAHTRRPSAAASGASAGAWLRIAGALVAGGVLWVPWLPTFRFQAEHTATPWTKPPKPWEVFDIPLVQSGGHNNQAFVTLAVFSVAVLVALAPTDGALGARLQRLGADRLLGPRCAAAPLLGFVGGLAAVIAVAGAMQSGSALAGRYTSVLLPLFVSLIALGLARLRAVAVTMAVVVVVLAALSATLVVREIRSVRTPGRDIATTLATSARPGDVVLFCPDQLGPATVRELDHQGVTGLQLGTFPDWSDPGRVDWIDYTHRYESAVPAAFAEDAVRRAGEARVWLVWSAGYPPTQPGCRALRSALRELRPAEAVVLPDRPGVHLDHGALLSYAA